MELIRSLQNLLTALADFTVVLSGLLFPWLPLLAWIAFWLLMIDWKTLYPILARGAGLGVLLIGGLAVLAWSSLSAPSDGSHHLYGLTVINVVGKTVYVTGLLIIAMLCGQVQLSGALGRWGQFKNPPTAQDTSDAVEIF